ncbi:MAG: NosD domain-containing protein [Fibrobacteria bacterium]
MPNLSAFFAFLLIPAMLSASLTAVPVLQPSAKTVNVSTVSALVSALGSAAKGTTIMLADGTYDLSGVWPLRLRTDSVSLYGASQNPSRVIMKGGGFTSSNTNEELIKIEAKGIRLAYFTLRDGRANGVKIQTGANDGLFIHNVYFIDICERSIKGPDMPVTMNGVVQYCLFQQITPITSVIPNLNAGGDYIAGMDLMKIDGWNIHDNVFKNIQGMTGGGRAAIFLWNGCKNTTIERNLFLGCDRSIAFGNPMSTNVDMDGGIIRNNFIVAGKDISIEICNSTGSQIVNNTIYSTNLSFTRTISFCNAKTDNAFKDNLVLGKIGLNGGLFPDTAGNLFVTVAGGTATWFRDIAAGDLHLTAAATQAINKGVPLSVVKLDIDDAARDSKPDIGADEMASVTDISLGAPVSGAGKSGLSVLPIDRTLLPFYRNAAWYGADGRRLLLK